MTENNAPTLMSIAVLGGTGKEGSGLAMRWALNGYRVIIGSRSEEKAVTRAAELNEALGGDYLIGMANVDAAREAAIVVLSVPYSAHKVTLDGVKDHLAGKVLVDLTVPLNPPHVDTVFVPEGKSAALEAQAYLGDDVRVVAAFQNVSAAKLKDPQAIVACDVLVCGDDADAKADVIRLAEAAGMRGIDAGPLANAVAVEALTPVLIYINKTYKVKGAGIHITGIE
ncbi:MAG: NADPH-dependent F420 reductase [Chloroflexi bacterium]|nr:MAG: NADPH-dependent F420 reductase [Chloroflexota bacterium]